MENFGETMRTKIATTVSEDSASKHVGHIGQFISRIVEDQEACPDRHLYLVGIADG